VEKYPNPRATEGKSICIKFFPLHKISTGKNYVLHIQYMKERNSKTWEKFRKKSKLVTKLKKKYDPDY
jgi:hypothetical protein